DDSVVKTFSASPICGAFFMNPKTVLQITKQDSPFFPEIEAEKNQPRSDEPGLIKTKCKTYLLFSASVKLTAIRYGIKDTVIRYGQIPEPFPEAIQQPFFSRYFSLQYPQPQDMAAVERTDEDVVLPFRDIFLVIKDRPAWGNHRIPVIQRLFHALFLRDPVTNDRSTVL